MPPSRETRVAICIATFKRLGLLRDLLVGIGRLEFRKTPAPQLQIVVVDNDELASAQEVCRTDMLPWPIHYMVESRRGISYARNRTVAVAGAVDFVAFIDDDEVPSPSWLDELLWAQTEFHADVVSGPVSPRYDPDVPRWIAAGGFFDRRVLPSGTLRRACAANNALIGSHVFARVGRFDDAFALSGAEDTQFFLRVSHAGLTIVWSQEAVVFELIPAERGTVAWILRREYQTGNGWIFSEASLDNRPRSRAFRFCKASGHVVIGLLNFLWRSLLLDRAAVVRSLQRASLGTGMLTALAGHRFLAYHSPGAAPKLSPYTHK